MKAFLDTHWRHLVVATYEVSPDCLSVLERHLPPGTELDDFGGRYYASVVAFEFSKTRILGVPMPLYRRFPEVNLRFYVRRRVAGEWRRGVVFVKEIVPCRLPALIARWVFRENFHVHGLRMESGNSRLSYRWRHGDGAQRLEVDLTNTLAEPEGGTLEHYILENYWAYKDLGGETAGEFRVSHRPWRMRRCPEAVVGIDLEKVYGPDWARALGEKPVDVIYADGSRVGVTRPQRIRGGIRETIPQETYQHIPDGII